MAELPLPNHVVMTRRDGRREVLLHRSMAVIGQQKIEIKAARSTVILPLFGLVLAALLITWMALSDNVPFWALVSLLFVCLAVVPASVMGLVSSIVGADVVIDATKGSITWQQGYLGMGIGTRELVPFAKIDHFEVTVEGEDADRWRDQTDDLRQFALVLVKASGRRLNLIQIPVPVYGQADGMDRTLTVGNAVAALTGSTVRIPEGWELVEIDTDTGETVAPPAPPATPSTSQPKRRAPR